ARDPRPRPDPGLPARSRVLGRGRQGQLARPWRLPPPRVDDLRAHRAQGPGAVRSVQPGGAPPRPDDRAGVSAGAPDPGPPRLERSADRRLAELRRVGRLPPETGGVRDYTSGDS